MFVKVLIGIAALVVLVLIVAATRPTAYHVERTLEIAAPTNVVFGILNDLHQFPGVMVIFGSPFETSDATMQKTIEGPASGPGQSYAWVGKDAGKGRMTIEKSIPDQQVVTRLDFEKPMKSTSITTLALAGTPTGSQVTWTMDGNHNLIGKVFGLFMNMDRMLGADIEKSLERLNTVAAGKR
ncbi:MAG TPA: SRPBCC family protein [Candidatus Eisenbacteria bacterium]